MEVAEKKARFWCPLACLNPIWVVATLIKNYKKDKKFKKYNYLLECSRVVNEFPIDLKQKLTTSKEGEETVTPQQFFLEYFANATIKHEDPEVFASKFTEFYEIRSRKIIEELDESIEIEDPKFREKFWNNFKILFKQKARINRNKDKNISDSRRKIKILLKVLFSGLGDYNFPF